MPVVSTCSVFHVVHCTQVCRRGFAYLSFPLRLPWPPQVQHVLSSVELYNPNAAAPPAPGAAGPGDLGAAAAAAGGVPVAASPLAACGCGWGSWQRGPDMVLPRSAHACAVLGGCWLKLGQDRDTGLH